MGVSKKIFKKLFFWMFLFLIVFFSLELISFFYLKFSDDYFISEDYIISSDEQLMLISTVYDCDIGWDNPYETELGNRPLAVTYDEKFMSTFGDSFTECAQVGHHETWQYYLSDRVKKNVYNFGVGGYGTGQAYLKYKKLSKELNTDIAVLGFISENINRVVNVYRPFYQPNAVFTLTKPTFVVEEDKLLIIENPIQHEEDLEKLKDKEFIDSLGETDYWYNYKYPPNLSSSHTKFFFNNLWRQLSQEEFSLDYEHLWKDEETVRIMFSIFDSFVTDVQDQGSVPIIIILPMKHEVIKYNRGEDLLFLNKTLDYCKEKEYLCFNSIEVLASSTNNLTEINSYFNGHVSAKGNKLIADGFYEFLIGKGLI